MGKKLWTINRWLAEYLFHYKYTYTAFSRAKNIGCYIIELVPERCISTAARVLYLGAIEKRMIQSDNHYLRLRKNPPISFGYATRSQ
jgi:hypothetical protein